jgi:hypothetical protein
MDRQGKAGQGKTRQSKAMCVARQVRAHRQCRALQGKASQGRARQGKAPRQCKAGRLFMERQVKGMWLGKIGKFDAPRQRK